MYFELPVINRRTQTIIQIMGGLLFVVSFFMPAVYVPAQHDGSWGDVDHTPNGLFCAIFSLVMLAGSVTTVFHQTSPDAHTAEGVGLFLAGCSGLINPLLLTYVLVAPSWRRHIAVVIWIGMVSGGLTFFLLKQTALEGFFFWNLGVLLVLSPEFVRKQPSSTTGEDDFME